MKKAKKRNHAKTKHAHRKALIAQKKSKGKFSKSHLPKDYYSSGIYRCNCCPYLPWHRHNKSTCWASGKYCDA